MGKLVFPFQPIDLSIVYPGEYQMPMEDAKSIDESPLSISEVCALLFHGHSHEGSFDWFCLDDYVFRGLLEAECDGSDASFVG